MSTSPAGAQIAPVDEEGEVDEEAYDDEDDEDDDDEEDELLEDDYGGGKREVVAVADPVAIAAGEGSSSAVGNGGLSHGGGGGSGDCEIAHGARRDEAGLHEHAHLNDDLPLGVAAKEADTSAAQKHFRGAWKDEWVVTLIHARGSMDEDFSKSQRPGVDMWARVAMQIAATHMDFDKNSESCRKKWQRVLKTFKDCKAHNAVHGNEKQMTCKFYDLIDHYTCYSSDGHAISMDESVPLEMGSPQVTCLDSAQLPTEVLTQVPTLMPTHVQGVPILPYALVTPLDPARTTPSLEFRQASPLVSSQPVHADSLPSQVSYPDANNDLSSHRMKSRVKRIRRDEKIEKSLSQMVEIWRESLEVMKEAEAKRIEILQTLSATMVGLLDVLRKNY